MLKEDLIEMNPLRVLTPADKGKTEKPQMGLVMARAGLGKTAILVQIALDSMLRGNKVLHVSIGQSLEKTKIWYDDIFQDIAKSCKLERAAEIQEELMSQRMIMTFNEESFGVAKLRERLKDLIDQNIFQPDCLLVDGFDCSISPEKILGQMRDLAQDMNLNMWFSAVSPALTIGSIASTIPASSTGPQCAGPKFGISGGSCRFLPIPCPTNSRTTE